MVGNGVIHDYTYVVFSVYLANDPNATWNPRKSSTAASFCFSGNHPPKMFQALRVRFGKTLLGANILLMVQKSGGHQLRLVVCPFIYKVLCIQMAVV